MLRRTGLQSLENAPGPVVRPAHLFLFGIAQSQDSEGENLVYFRTVEEIAFAFGRQFRVLVKNDRRGQYSVTGSGLAHQYRPNANVLAGGDVIPKSFGRVELRDESAIIQLEHRVCRGQRMHESDITSFCREGAYVPHANGQPKHSGTNACR